MPAVPPAAGKALEHVAGIRAVIAEHVSIGVSGDASAARGLSAGCDAWYSVIGGTLPELALPITRAAQAGNATEALAESARLTPLWELFTECGGSLRVVAAIAEQLGLAQPSCLPLPILGLDKSDRARVAACLAQLGL
jgi:4-hydroxy-tetrahydrodipicolinate synthase